MRVLVINPFGIGDVLFSLPLIQNIKFYFPTAEVYYLCNKRTYPLLNVQPLIDGCIVFEKDEWRQKFRQSRFKTIKEFRKFLKEIKNLGIEMVFDLSLAQEFGFFCWLIGIKNRLGFDYRRRGIFLTDRIKISGYNDKHMVEYYNWLLELLGVRAKFKEYKIQLPEDKLKWAEEKLSDLKARHGIIISVVPGGGASWGKDAYRKRWDEGNFKCLVELIREQIKAGVVLLGDEKDRERFGRIGEDPSVLNFLGKTDLLSFSALISKCDLLITNDGGPLHIGVALGVPTISIFGPVPDFVYGPYPPSKIHKVIKLNLPCQPCYRNFKVPACENIDCLKKLRVEFVLEELKKHLSLVLSEV
jgi:ADP-heptose:LPS heptosyltransferase